MMSTRLKGKTCIVTGSGGSIGRATCLRFAEEGANIVGCDIAPEASEETLRQVEAAGGTMVSIHPADLTVRKNCDEVVQAAVRRFGGVDVLFNNGAMAYLAWIEEMTEEIWSKTIHEELTIVYMMSRAAWGELGKSSGNIVNTASLQAWLGLERVAGLAHTAAKGGVVSMTRQLAMEGRKLGIRANSVSPGTIETNQTRFILNDPEWATAQLGRVMLNRAGQPHEIAAAVAFLASDDASYVTGTDLGVDGGARAW